MSNWIPPSQGPLQLSHQQRERAIPMNSFRLLVALALTVACATPAAQTSAGAAANETREDRNGTRSQLSTKSNTYVISKSGMGGIRLEMTLDEARRALPVARFARASDGDGAALVEVTIGPAESMILRAEEDDPRAAIDWSKRIKTIETFSQAFHTVEGVRPGSLVRDAETVFGKTTEIRKSEIESREYIFFETQPAYLTFRLDYTGIFSAGTRKTREFEPRAKILSIAVSSY